MPDTPFHSLSDRERLDALLQAAESSRRQPYLLEKDIWVVQTLAALVDTPFGSDLTFKGGTSLSKAYSVIQRFSEDLDITYDIGKLIPGLPTQHGADPLPASRNQADKWTAQVRESLGKWLDDEAVLTLRDRLCELDVSVEQKSGDDCIYVVYKPLFKGSGFVSPEVKVEFGARSTGEPRSKFEIACDAAPHLPGLEFPTATPHVMLAERTFWEKATAAHVFCRRGRGRGDRLSRHWHDLVRLDESRYAEKALDDHETAIRVASHKKWFFRENDSTGAVIDYLEAVSGDLQLVPAQDAYEILAKDYKAMKESGMLLNDDESFGDLMEKCADIEKRANDGIRAGAVRSLTQ